MLERLTTLDRRIVFILVALAVIVPTAAKVSFPIRVVSRATQRVYNTIEALPEGSVVMVAFDYGPASMAELQPMAYAVMQHLFARKLKVIGVALLNTGVPLGDQVLTTAAEEFKAQEGIDYVYLGFRAGATAVILGMGEDIHDIFSQDTRGVSLSERPMMADIRNYDDIDLLVDFGAGSSPEMWVTYAYARYQQKIAVGVVGVSISLYYPFLQTGQVVGLLPGLLGAAEYEALVGHPAKATLGMSVQSVVHLMLIGLVILGNVTHFMLRRRERAGEQR